MPDPNKVSDIRLLRVTRDVHADSDGFANKPEADMWTGITRAQPAHKGLALPSDLHAAEWAIMERFLPAATHVGLRWWVVERTFAWRGRNRRLAKDFEKSIESSAAWLSLAAMQHVTRRIAALSA